MDDLDALASVVAGAFEDDPVMAWLLPDASTRPEGTRRWWTPIVASYLAADRALSSTDLNACLLWRRSDERLGDAPGQPPMRELLAQLVPAARAGQVASALAVFPRLRPQEPHVYVHVVATRPDHQGRGHGARLVAALEGAAAGPGLCCLESTNPRNHPFYLRNGFRAGAQETLPGSTVTATSFARRATATGSAGL